MKLIRVKFILLSCLVLAVVGLTTRTKTETTSKTNTKTSSKTEAKTSIFSYDFLSVMKKKMKAMKEREKMANTYQSQDTNQVSAQIQDTNAKDNAKFSSNAVDPSLSNNGKVPGNNSGLAEAGGSDAAAEGDSAQKGPPTPLADPQKGPIYFSGWVKYFKFDDGNTHGEKPNSFFKNNQYYEQTKYNPDMNIRQTSSDGLYQNVPGPTSFFATLFKDHILITQSRIGVAKRVVDSLIVDHIQPVLEGNGFSGGIIDFGAFNEGFCFKLATNTHMTWIFCSETGPEKKTFMKAIKDIKLMGQRNKGEIVMPVEKKTEESLSNIFRPSVEDLKKEEDLRNPKGGNNLNAKDGYWIVLQDWSQCSKKCDSGVTTFHRLCIPAHHGGKPCEGEAVMTKPCNTQPCPKVNGADGAANKKILEAQKPVTLKPIIKIMRYSNRPQRYHKCIIKEGDLMMTKEEEITQTNLDLLAGKKKTRPVQVPVRAILNNSTLSFYENAEDFGSHAITYNLKTSDFSRSVRDKSCFIINEGKHRTELCPLGIDKSAKDFEEWDRDFHIFKYNCETKPDEMEIELKERFQEKLKDAKTDMLIEREELVKQKIHKKDQDTSFNIIKQTNQVAQQAILKEENLEEMIQKEEEERETREEIELKKQIEKEQKKDECILHAIKERELENQYQIKTKETQKEVETIKELAMKEVVAKRNKLKEKISDMRKKAKRNEIKLKQTLLNMRMKMAREMTDIYKDGDQGKCLNAIKDAQVRLNYCTANFSDIIKFSQCKDDDDFCLMCCENEFGEMHIDKRNKCIKEICEPNAGKTDDTKGGWYWSDGEKKKKFGEVDAGNKIVSKKKF